MLHLRNKCLPAMTEECGSQNGSAIGSKIHPSEIIHGIFLSHLSDSYQLLRPERSNSLTKAAWEEPASDSSCCESSVMLGHLPTTTHTLDTLPPSSLLATLK